MNPSYSTYPNGYAPAQYPVVAPNQFYAPPPVTQQYNGYAAPYQPRYRRPSDPGPQMHESKLSAPRRGRPARQSEDDETIPRISRPLKQRRPSIRPGITPDFLFITLSSHDTLKIANVKSSWLLDYLRETLLPYWPQRIVSESEEYGEWQVKLGGEVWTAGGTHGIIARRFVCRLFTVMAEEGFGYLATVDNHPMKAPRLVFTSVPSEIQPRYFMIAFSLNRRTVTIIDAPEKLAILLGAALRATEPLARSNQAATTPGIRPSDVWVAPGVYEVVTSENGMKRQDLATLMGGVLKLIVSEGWRFEASVPFGKAGLFGLRGRREVWMFRRDSTAQQLPKLRRETRRRA